MTTKAMNVKGTDNRDCPDYLKGLCHSDDCYRRGHERCIGTRMCDNFWVWFLKENNLTGACFSPRAKSEIKESSKGVT